MANRQIDNESALSKQDDKAMEALLDAHMREKLLDGRNCLLSKAVASTYRTAYRAALPKWQDIDTAPCDGTQILIYSQGCPHGVIRANFCDRIGAWDSEAGMLEVFPCQWANTVDQKTKWMPLPNPPKDKTP